MENMTPEMITAMTQYCEMAGTGGGLGFGLGAGLIGFGFFMMIAVLGWAVCKY